MDRGSRRADGAVGILHVDGEMRRADEMCKAIVTLCGKFETKIISRFVSQLQNTKNASLEFTDWEQLSPHKPWVMPLF
jgi:hypothetical protein